MDSPVGVGATTDEAGEGSAEGVWVGDGVSEGMEVVESCVGSGDEAGVEVEVEAAVTLDTTSGGIEAGKVEMGVAVATDTEIGLEVTSFVAEIGVGTDATFPRPEVQPIKIVMRSVGTKA